MLYYVYIYMVLTNILISCIIYLYYSPIIPYHIISYYIISYYTVSYYIQYIYIDSELCTNHQYGGMEKATSISWGRSPNFSRVNFMEFQWI